MRKFKSINRAIKRGHLKIEPNLALGRNAIYVRVKKKNVNMKGETLSKSANGWALWA